MKLYSITIWQLIIIWIFGTILTIYFIDEGFGYRPESWATMLSYITPGVILFYTFGWAHYKRKNK